MFITTLYFIFSLFLILISAELFTNGVEVLGNKYSFSKAVIGSIIAAVGTALPETILPIVAILFLGKGATKDIGVGAILGAPFMLSTVGFFLVGSSVTALALIKKRKYYIEIELRSVKRDTLFFVMLYSVSVFVPLLIGQSFNALIAVLLLTGYLVYAAVTIRSESGKLEHFEDLYTSRLVRYFGINMSDPHHIGFIALQVIGTLIVMIIGAHLFVGELEVLSLHFGISPLLFALMIAPIATELPEKFNSVTWIFKGRDALAIGNITGAMVFQATFPVSIGLLFTEWKLTGAALLSAVIALVSALIMLVGIIAKKRVSPITMLLGGMFYALYIAALIIVR